MVIESKCLYLFKNRSRKFPRLPTISGEIDCIWQADLLDMSAFSRYNNEYNNLMVAIDILSRYGFVQPMKNKSSDSVITSFKKIFSRGIKAQENSN